MVYKLTMATFHTLICLTSFLGSVKTLGIRPFPGETKIPNCSGQTRRAAVGCPCSLVGVPCADVNSLCVAVASRARTSVPGSCTCAFGSTLIAGTTSCSVAIFAPTDPLVSATACPGDNVFDLACGGPQPLTCSLTFFNTSSTDAAGVRYTSSQTFLTAVNPASGCCFATVTKEAPSTDALECFLITARDTAGNTKTGSTCALIKAPSSTLTCPAVSTGVLSVAPIVAIAFGSFCQPKPLQPLVASGGMPPYVFTITLTSSSGVDGFGATFDNQPLVVVDSTTGRVTVDPVSAPFSKDNIFQCYVGTVKDKNGATSTTPFCVSIEGSGFPTPRTC